MLALNVSSAPSLSTRKMPNHSELGAVPIRNCWDPRTWPTDGFEPAPKPTIMRPNPKDELEVDKSVAEEAMRDGSGVQVTDKALLQTLQQTMLSSSGEDISPAATSDDTETMYVVDHRIFVRVVGFAGPSNDQWYEVNAPQF